MSKFLLAALALTAINGVSYAQLSTKTVPAESSLYTLSESDPVGWVRPKTVVAPGYPTRAVEAKTTGYVDVDVLVAEDGSVGEIRSMVSIPKNDDFEHAVREVIKLWTFHTAWSNCRPFESVGNVRVWFDIKNEAGVVSISNRTKRESAASAAPKHGVRSANAAAIRAAVRYPVRARKAGAEGTVSIKVFVDVKTGAITNIEVPYASSKPPGYQQDFVERSKAAVAAFTFEPIAAPDEPTTEFDKPIWLCVPFEFRLR